ncbi:glutathione S-transferase [Alteromonadaceae bacterium 2753L.S.0a.02]|nr:glutathione S-transferase [Alteromonadaceae bacterium 2753L.S.0a.02]
MYDITLYGLTGSTYLRTVQMVCLHKQLSFEIKPLEFRSASHRELHPFLRMPVMQHNGTRLFETLAICSYLEDLVPEPVLLPAEPIRKALTLQWVSAYIDYLCPALIRAKPEDETQAWPESTNNCLAILDETLAHQPFLAGDFPSLADLLLSPAIDYALGGHGFDDKLAKHPHLVAWWQKASACAIFEQAA